MILALHTAVEGRWARAHHTICAQGHTAAIVSVEPTLLLKFDFLMTALVSIAARRLSLIAVSGASL